MTSSSMLPELNCMLFQDPNCRQWRIIFRILWHLGLSIPHLPLEEKKDGSLRPYIEIYYRLNDITIKNCYPFPLLSSAFELPQGATTYSIMDLNNAYHLVPICECKTAFKGALTPGPSFHSQAHLPLKSGFYG